MARPLSLRSDRRRRQRACGRAATIVMAAALFSLSAALAQTTPDAAVVLASDTPSLPTGSVLDLHGPIVLAQGASATLLLRSGEILRVKGPFTGALADAAGPPRSGISVYAEMLRMRGVDASNVGGTRALSALARKTPAAASADDVVLSAAAVATYCVAPGASVWVGRPTGGGGHYELRRAGMFRTIVFPDGATRAPWPDDVSIEDRDHFDLLRDGVAVASYIIRVQPATPASVAAAVAANMLDGCRDQAAPLLAELARRAAANDPAD